MRHARGIFGSSKLVHGRRQLIAVHLVAAPLYHISSSRDPVLILYLCYGTASKCGLLLFILDALDT